MMKTEQIFFLLGLLLPLCTVVTSNAIKVPVHAAQKPGQCPTERYYIKTNNPGIINKRCENDFKCPDNWKCCKDNRDMMCKPPVQERAGQCPTFDSSLNPATRCNDNCTDDNECPGNFKCCFKFCGKTCVPNLSNMGKPNTGIPARNGFCKQEALYRCAQPERAYCDESSCPDGFKCCPQVCRVTCDKALSEKNGKCPANAGCPSGIRNTNCTSDYDCTLLYKCCSTSCGQRCLLATNVILNIFYANGTSLNLG